DAPLMQDREEFEQAWLKSRRPFRRWPAGLCRRGDCLGGTSPHTTAAPYAAPSVLVLPRATAARFAAPIAPGPASRRLSAARNGSEASSALPTLCAWRVEPPVHVAPASPRTAKNYPSYA